MFYKQTQSHTLDRGRKLTKWWVKIHQIIRYINKCIFTKSRWKLKWLSFFMMIFFYSTNIVLRNTINWGFLLFVLSYNFFYKILITRFEFSQTEQLTEEQIAGRLILCVVTTFMLFCWFGVFFLSGRGCITLNWIT